MAILLAMAGHERWAVLVAGLWLINLVWKAITFPVRRRARNKASELLQHLIDVYAVLGNQTISPRKLKDSLDQAVGSGVVLDGAVFTIVDRMFARDATAFIPTQVSA